MIWIDFVLLGIVALSVLLGLWRGFVREALSLIAWVSAFWVGMRFSPMVAVGFSDYISLAPLRTGLAFAALFLATLVIVGLINWLIVRLVRAAGFGFADRLAGMVFGAGRGVVLVSVAVLLAGMTVITEEPWWRDSIMVGYCQEFAGWFGTFIPADMADSLLAGRARH